MEDIPHSVERIMGAFHRKDVHVVLITFTLGELRDERPQVELVCIYRKTSHKASDYGYNGHGLTNFVLPWKIFFSQLQVTHLVNDPKGEIDRNSLNAEQIQFD